MYDTGRQAAGMKGSKAIMEEKKNLLTYAGLKKLEEELARLKSERPAIIQAKAQTQHLFFARGQGIQHLGQLFF